MEFFYIYGIAVFSVLFIFIIIMVGLLIHQFERGINGAEGDRPYLTIGYAAIVFIGAHVAITWAGYSWIIGYELIGVSIVGLSALITANWQAILGALAEDRASRIKKKKKQSRQNAIDEAQKLLDDL